MAALLKRLQAQSSYAYQLQQPTLFYGYKKFELQAGPLGLKALKHSKFLSFAVFTNNYHFIRSTCFSQFIASILGLHLQNSRFPTVLPILKLAPNRANQ